MPIGIHNPTVSLKPRLGRSWKRARRIEIVARLESKFLSDQDIANHLGLTVGAIQAIKRSPEFTAKRNTLATGILSVYDQAMLTGEENQKAEVEDMIPLALGAVKEALLDKTSPHHMKAALDMLDRARSTAKITKLEHSVADKSNINKENEQARKLLAMLDAPPEVNITPETPYNPPVMGLIEDKTSESEIKDAAEELLDTLSEDDIVN